jgi:hypothetical protein
MLYYYLLFVSGFSLLTLITSSMGLASDIGEIVTGEFWRNYLYGHAGMALVAGSIWWLHWRSLATLWPSRDRGDQVFAKIYLWGMTFLMMLIILVVGSELVANLLRLLAGDLGINQAVTGNALASFVRLLIALPLWRLHWQQVKLHSGPQANQPEAGEQPA